MASLGWILLVGGLTAAAIAGLVWRPLRARLLECQFSRARRDFHRQRERLEAKFVALAATRGEIEPDAWEHCQFDDDVAYVRNRSTGELSAFGAVSLGIDMYDVRTHGSHELLGNLRAGTAVFRFDGRRWDTDGRAILNLSPVEAIRFYRDDLEVVGQE